MASQQQALLMDDPEGEPTPPVATCVADQYYSCGPDGDPYFSSVVALLHFDGTNGGTTFTDNSPSAKTNFTRTGDAQTSTAVVKFGTAAGLFDGSGDYVSSPSSVDWVFGTGDYTAEAWVYLAGASPVDSGSGTRTAAVWSTKPFSSGFNLTINGNASVTGISLTAEHKLSGSSQNVNGTFTFSYGQWYHVAVSKSGTTVRIFVDGTQVGSGTVSLNLTYTSEPLYLGSNTTSGNFSYFLNGYIDDFRLTKGVARYTGNFTIPTEAYPDYEGDTGFFSDPRTVLSLHAEDVMDSSCYQEKTVALAGTATVSTAEKKFELSSFLVPNVGSSTLNGVSVTDHQDFDFGTSDFTVECWAYRNANTYVGYLFYATMGGEFSLRVLTTGLITIQYRSSGGAQTRTTSVSFPLTQWNFVVVQRRGLNFEFYLNGVLEDTVAITGGASSTVNSSGDWFWGRTNASSATSWNGYIDEVRVTRGIARYVIDYTVPTAAFPDSAPDDPDFASVSTLLHFDGSNGATTFTDSASSPKIYAATGAVLSTAEKKFGTASGFFDGSNDYISCPTSTDFDFGSGDFTVECWINTTLVPATGTIVTNRATSGSDPGFNFVVTSAGLVSFVAYGPTAGTVLINLTSTSGAITANTWTHIAASRSGTTAKLFVNGIQVFAQGISTTAIAASSNALNIGRDPSTSRPYAGYIDDLRITKGVARYTADFDPASLPNCDSTSGGSVTPVFGTAFLVGASVASAQGSVGVANPWKALSGQAVTVSAGTATATLPDRSASLVGQAITASVPSIEIPAAILALVGRPMTMGQGTVVPVQQNREAALVGQSVVVSRGSISVAPYPNLFVSSTSPNVQTSEGTTGFFCMSFLQDGTRTFRWFADGVEFVTAVTGLWIDSANVNYVISDIAHQYELRNPTVFSGGTYLPSRMSPEDLIIAGGTPPTLSLPAALSSAIHLYIFVQMPGLPSRQINAQIAVVPGTTNPRYAEAGYYGLISGTLGITLI